MRKKLSLLSENGHHEVFLYFHDHIIVLLPPLIEYLIGWIIFGFLLFASFLLRDVWVLLDGVMYLFSISLLLFVHHLFFVRLLSWELSDWVITRGMVIDFGTNLSTVNDVVFIDIHEIAEIEKRKHGFFSNLFGYGDVYINLAAAPYPIICHSIPHPEEFVELVEAIREKRIIEADDLLRLRKQYGNKFQFVLEKI